MNWYDYLKNAYWVLEGVAALIAFLNIRHLKAKSLASFAWFLTSIFVLETVGHILVRYNLAEANQALNKYGIMPVILLYYFWLYSRQITNRQGSNKVFIVAAIIYIVSIIIERTFFTGTTIIFSFSRSIGTVIFLLFIIRYFIRLAMSDRIIYFRYEFFFWVSTGCIIYYGITLPYFATFSFLPVAYPHVFLAYSYALYPLKFCLYACYITAILCSRKK